MAHAPLAEPTLRALLAVSNPDDVSTRAANLAAMAHDASHYLLRPRAVVTARDTGHVAELLRVATEHALSVTFRSGGTSLSGQACGDSLLLYTRRHFRRVVVLDNGTRVRTGPGATVRAVNARLAAHQTKLGPDPASEAACTVGGVIANNSSGMACGTEFNAYRTVDSLTFVLPSGTTIDTADPTADELLRAAEPRLSDGLAKLRDRIRADPDSVTRIRHQFSMKNTMGYSLNAFLDDEQPVHILSHLLIGSEGTLGFVGEVTLRTVPVRSCVATALLVFDTMSAATDALPALLAVGPRTVQLMDAASLRVVQRDPQASPALAALEVAAHAALLVELQATTGDELAGELAAARQVVGELMLSTPAKFTSDPTERTALWRLRKGLFPAVAGARPAGTTALLEDIVVPLAVLTSSPERLIGLFDRYGYHDAVVFGHAKDGNLHFMINPRFDDPAELERYEAFTEDLVALVLSANGSLKAEHGTGRIMAPYVRRQFGDSLYTVMQTVKDLCDPEGVLSPGIVLSDDSRMHVSHLKTTLPVDPAVDACVECGFCEPVCSSGDVTTTPRQRIVLMREIAQAEVDGDADRVSALERDFAYEAVDTCAADSIGMTACPVNIDTGEVLKRDRAGRQGRTAQRAGVAAAGHWQGTVVGLRAGLRIANALLPAVVARGSRAARTVLSPDWVPQIGEDLPGPGPRRPLPAQPADAAAVFFPACVGSMLGPDHSSGREAPLGPTDAYQVLCARASLSLAIPEGIEGLCCGIPWRSKGLTYGYDVTAHRTFEAVWRASEEGRLPVVSDAASCSLGLRQIGEHLAGDAAERYPLLQIIDSVSFVRASVLPRLTLTRRLGSVALHPTCSSVHLGSTADLEAVAGACAGELVVPTSWNCCGFAGDRGMLHPAVTAAATAAQAAELAGRDFDAYVCDNRTCEMGMSRATHRAYRHVLELLEACTR